jgi:AcrR family transcriptional regulator
MTLVQKRPVGRPCDAALQERRRQAILTVAATIFAKHGFAATDVQWIADRLKISKGTVYRYFPSKQQLFLSAVERGVSRMQQEIESAKIGAGGKIDEIRAAVVAYLKFFKENPELVELFIQERAEFRDEHRPVYFQHRDARKGPWRQRVAELMTEGLVRQIPVERVTEVLGDVLYGTMFTNHFAGRKKPYEAQALDVIDVVFNGILTERGREHHERSKSQR